MRSQKTCTSKDNIIDYWRLGEELSLSVGNSVLAETEIEPVSGVNYLTAKTLSSSVATVVDGRIPDIRNKEVLLSRVVQTFDPSDKTNLIIWPVPIKAICFSGYKCLI